MASTSGFSLSKWYLDCVTEEGEVCVGYSASLRWKVLSLEYSSILIRRSSGQIQTKTTLHGGMHPVASGNTVRWDCPSLKLKGLWHATQGPIRKTVFGTSNTPIAWSCLQPHAAAEISVADIGTFKGFGYVDYLDLPAPPWKLPVDELRWGRYLSETDSIIWMDCRGSCPETLVFRNGAMCDDGHVNDSEINLGAGRPRLTFEETQTLREGVLAKTALSGIPGITTLLPARMLNTDEQKWRSRGILTEGDSVLGSGWTIHEVVRWPPSAISRRS